MKNLLLASIALLLLLPALAIGAGSASNTLAWDYGTYDITTNPLGLSATLIFRKTEPCAGTLPFSQIASVPFPTLTYDDIAVKQGATYCYEAKAQNPTTISDPSNLVAKTVPFGIPVAPGNLNVK